MAIYKTRTELANFELSNGKTVDLLSLIDSDCPRDWVAPTTAPEIGTVAYVDAMGRLRRGAVVKTTKTKVHVAVTTQGAVDDAMRRFGPTQPIRVQIVVADTNYVRVAPPAEPKAEALTLNSQAGKVTSMNNEMTEDDAVAAIQAATEAEGGIYGPINKAAILAKPIDTLMNSSVRETTGSAVVRLLERVHERIRENHPEVPAVVIVTGSGADLMGQKWGHFRPRGWMTRVAEEGAATHMDEMFMAGETLAKGARQVLQTMLHESAHALAEKRGEKDTSRQGRWHNRTFVKVAEELGLEYTRGQADKSIGFSAVTLTTETLEEYADLLAELDAEIHLTVKLPVWLGGAAGGDGDGEGMGAKPRGTEGGSTSNNLKLTCGCAEPNIIRASRKVADKLVVKCDDCDEVFGEK